MHWLPSARKYEAVLDESKSVKKGYRDGALVMIDGYLDESAYTVRIGKKRRYSDEQRAKMAERLKIAREKGGRERWCISSVSGWQAERRKKRHPLEDVCLKGVFPKTKYL